MKSINELQKGIIKAIGIHGIYRFALFMEYGGEVVRPSLTALENEGIISSNTGVPLKLTDKGLGILEQLEKENEM